MLNNIFDLSDISQNAFLIGIAASLAIWILTTKIFVPRIKLCKQIAKEKQKNRIRNNKSKKNSSKNQDSFQYNIKIQNKSWFRGAYDIKVIGRVYYKNVYLGFLKKDVPILSAKFPCKMAELFPWLIRRFDKHAYERIIPFNANIDQEKLQGFENNTALINKSMSEVLTLEDFKNGEKNELYLSITIWASDSFSGAKRRKQFDRRIKKKDFAETIKLGYFDKGSSRVRGVNEKPSSEGK